MNVDEGKMNQLVGQLLNDIGGAASVAMVRMGDALGLYKTLHEKGSMTCDQLAAAANVHPRYLREWLYHQAASGYLEYDAHSCQFTLPAEHAFVLADPQSPAYVLPGFAAAMTVCRRRVFIRRARCGSLSMLQQ